MFKLSLCVILAVCSLQSTRASPIDQAERDFPSIIATIKDIMTKMQFSIQDLMSKTAETLDNINMKIQETMKDLSISEATHQIQNQINDALNKAGMTVTTAEECMKSEKKAVAEFMSFASDSSANCMKEADAKIKSMNAQVDATINENMQVLADINRRVTTCLSENIKDESKLDECVTSQMPTIKEQADTVITDAQNTIDSAQKTANDVFNTLATCAVTVKTALSQKQTAIVDDFQKCINELQN